MQRTTGPPPDDRARGQTAVIAIVLLVGIVAVGSIGILLFGANATDQSQQNAEQERVKNAFTELDSDLDSVAVSSKDTRRVKMDLPDESDGAVRRENAGTIVVKRKNLTTTKTVLVKEIGAVTYTDGDVHYAYQAGAVWSGTGNHTQMISAPNFVYDTSKDGGDPTLTMAITDLEGQDRLASGDIKVRKMYSRAPLNDVATIDNQLVTVKIQSDYYVGWGHYFKDRYDDVIVNYDHPNDTVVVKFGKLEIGGNYNTGIVTGGDVNIDVSNHDKVNSSIKVAGSYTSDADTSCDGGSGSDCVDTGYSSTIGTLDQAIALKTESAKDECGGRVTCVKSLNASVGGGPEFQGGNVYYVERNSLLDGQSVQANLSTGNVTLILDGDLGVRQGTITATHPNKNATCCYLRIYFNGTDMAMGQKSGLHATTDNATRVQLYGTSDFHFDGKNMQSGDGWHAALYAPGEASTSTNDALDLSSSFSDVGSQDVCFGQGSGTVEGAVIAGSMCMEQSVSFDYAESLQHVQPTLGSTGIIPPPITFLHLSVNKVCVGDGPCKVDPTAEIHAPGSVAEDSTTTLSAAGKDYDGGSVSYSWSITSGGGSLTDANTKTPEYDAPIVGSDESVTIQVTVTDDEGATRTINKTITVMDTSGWPSANAGGPYTVDEGDSKVLDGNGNDPDGGSVSYSWTIVSGDGSFLDASKEEPTYDAPSSVSSNETVQVRLKVTDDEGDTATDTASITVNDTGAADTAPSVTLDSASHDAQGGNKYDLNVTFTASDTDGDLDDATVTVYRSSSMDHDVASNSSIGLSGSTDTVTVSFTNLNSNSKKSYPPYYVVVEVSDDGGKTDKDAGNSS